MGSNGVRRRADDEPRGFLPRARAAGPPAWRGVVDWLFADRAAIDQQGLLAERRLSPRPPGGDEPSPVGGREPGRL